MANPEHLEMLHQGVEAWNRWRDDNANIQPDLSDATLRNEDLRAANFRGAILRNADLEQANLVGAYLDYANLEGARLTDADLRGAFLMGANLHDADLSFAVLMGAWLNHAILRGAYLGGVNLTDAALHGADFSSAMTLATVFACVDLSVVRGLETVDHQGPSSIGIDTLYKSEGNIPVEFLRGAGVPEDVITDLLPSILSGPTIQWYSCFISHSTQDKEFADLLYARLKAKNVRVYYAPEDLKGGVKLHEQLERAIQMHERLLLVLSDHSILSPWVEREIRHAYEIEQKEKRTKLFPIRLTDYQTYLEWQCPDSKSGRDLAEEVRQYFIPDFSNWKDHDAFEKSFDKLLADLKSGGKTPGISPK